MDKRSEGSRIEPRISDADIEAFRTRLDELRTRRQQIHDYWSRDRRGPARARVGEAVALVEDLQREAERAGEELRVQNEQLRDAVGAMEGERRGYREIFERAPDAQLITDRVGVLHDANGAARALLGGELPLLRGRPLTLFLTKPDHATFRTAMEGLPRAEALVRVRNLDGSVSPMRLRGAHLGAHRVVWVMTRSAGFQSGVFEKPLRPTSPSTSDGVEALGPKGISDDLRAPLLALLQCTRTLRDETLDPSRRERTVELIEKSALTQAALVEDVLDVLRLQNARLAMEAATVDLGKLVVGVADTVRPAAMAKEVELEVDVAGALPVQGDEHRLSQILMSLLANAIKFTPAEGNVTVTAHEHIGEVVLVVKDTGRGIRPESLESIFGCFVQDAPPDTRAGMGLGLYITKQLVELHGGRVTASSGGEGRGARFVVRFPLDRASTHPSVAAQSAGP